MQRHGEASGLCHHLLLAGAQHNSSWTALPVVPAAMEVSTDLGLFSLPLLWLSPLAGAGSCSHPPAAVPCSPAGQRPSLSLAEAMPGTMQALELWWLLASFAVCGVGCQCLRLKQPQDGNLSCSW